MSAAKKQEAIEKMSGESMNPLAMNREKLKEMFPGIFSDGRVDCDELKKLVGIDLEDSKDRYGISWAGKAHCFKEIERTTTKTLRTDRECSVDFDTTENIFIEGDNLEALKVLQRSYYGKVKMIYIDPPYNTGKDFIYTDKFARTEDEEGVESGDKDGEGNVTRRDRMMLNDKSKGRFHSNWLNMMYPRLYLARNLLRQDGVIFVSIDDNEIHNLRMVMNEIFGEENFIAQVVWEKMYTTKNDAKTISNSHEYILVYARSFDSVDIGLLPRTQKMDARYTNPDNDVHGPWKPVPMYAKGATRGGSYEIISSNGEVFLPPPDSHWRYPEKTTQLLLQEGRIYFGIDNKSQPNLKRYLSEVQDGLVARSLWKYDDVGTNDSGKRELRELFGDAVPFDFPKPTTLLRRMITLASDQDGVYLDFFAGSGTTAHAVMAQNAEDRGNRKCISIQLPEEVDPESEAGKAGYKTIADIARERIRRAGKKILEENSAKIAKREVPIDIGFKALKLENSNFKVWNINVGTEEELKTQLMEFVKDPYMGDSTEENILYELILKNGLPLTVDIEKKDGFYTVVMPDNGALAISLVDEMTQEIFTNILATNPTKITLLDSAFKGNDQLKTNLLLQAKDQGVNVVVM